MPTARITAGPSTGRVAPRELLGHNLEMFDRACAVLNSDRLLNPKFAGPANPLTGIAREWHPNTSNYMGVAFELTPGEGIMGSEAQTVRVTSDRPRKGLVQPRRWVRRGERLEVSLWARAIHDPVTIHAAIRPAAIWSDEYAGADLHIDSGCWQELRAVLEVPVDDDDAVFCLWFEQPGLLALDQVHLRPLGSGPIRDDVLDALGDFAMPLVRFPGGCLTTCYHWRYGTGPHYLRPVLPDPVFKREMNYEFGTDEFLDFCLRFGITPVLTVNVGTGTPDEAAEWAAYCRQWYTARGIEPPLIYWQLGNEQYGHWEHAHMSGEMYARAIRDLAPGIREAYPHARIVALGMPDGEALQREDRPWRAPLLDGAGDLVDVLAMQFYANLPLSDDPAELHTRVLRRADHYARELRAALDDCRARGLATTVSLSEWNLWLHASHFAPQGFYEPMDIQHGLYAATMFHHFARLAPDMEFAAMYQIIDAMCTITIDRDRITPTHMAEVFQCYRPAFPGTLLPLEVASPPFVEDIPAVDALALQQDAGTWVFLVNRGLETVTADLHGLPAPRDGVTLAGNDLFALEANYHPADITGNTVTLPPLSITRVRG
jgi:alpha-L-arabinofuranosidase